MISSNISEKTNDIIIDSKYLDYIDEIFAYCSSYISGFILENKVQITANMISISSILLSISLIYFIKYKKQYKIAAFIFLITRYFDTLDGILARKGNMTSSFGEKLDHYGDILLALILSYLIIDQRSNKNIFYWIIPIFAFLIISLSMSCQQKWINSSNRKEKNDTIALIHKFCPNQLYDNPEIFKIFGYGSGSLILSLYIYNLNKFTHK